MKRARKKLNIAVLIAVLSALFIAAGAALWAIYNYTLISPCPVCAP